MKSWMTSFAVSSRVSRFPRWSFGVPGRSPAFASSTARIDPERSSVTTMSIPLSSERWSLSTLTGRAIASTRNAIATARSDPGTSRRWLRIPRGPATSGATVPSLSRGLRASCAKIPQYQTAGTAISPSSSHGLCQLAASQASPRMRTG
jgi:hypothetical protein